MSGNNEIGGRIYDLRNEHHIQQCELAKAVGLHQSVLNRIEKGTRPIRAVELADIAAYFDVTMEYLLGKSAESLNTVKAAKAVQLDTSLNSTCTEAEADLLEQFRRLDALGRRAVLETAAREREYSAE